MTTLHKNTFGSEKAAIVLSEILNEVGNPRLVSKVSTYLTEHNALMKNIDSIPDAHSRLALTELVSRKIKADKFNWPEKVLTYTKNVALSRVKRQIDNDTALVRGERAAAARERSLEKNNR